MSKFKIVLIQPEIPGNTGTIGRTCVALDLELILIKPLGFDLSEKQVRRAGLDYWKYVKLKEYDSWGHFVEVESPDPKDLFFFSKSSKTTYFEADFHWNCYLIFGNETSGIPSDFFSSFSERFYTLPMFSDKVRSLNLSNAATAVAYEALRKSMWQKF